MLGFWVLFYVEKFILCGVKMFNCYNSCGVIILAFLGSVGYICFLPTFHKTYLTKAREKRETKPFKRQLVYHQPIFMKKPFSGVSTIGSPIILAASWGHIGLHFGRLDRCFEFWIVGYDFWTEPTVLGEFFHFCFLIVAYYGCLFLDSLRTLWRI